MLNLPKELSSLSPDEPLAVAAQAAWIAGRLILEFREKGFDFQAKPGQHEGFNLVTSADLAAERAIAEVIRQAFPHHELMGEEGLIADASATHLWIIDPIDGTNNFAHGIPHFAVSIGYYLSQEPVCGVVLNPARGDWFWAQRGRGAYANGSRLRVNAHRSLEQTMVGCGFYYDRGAMMRATLATIEALFERQIHGIRRMGTAALDFCGVAAGHFGAYFEYQLNAWDFAAGKLIVEEAGGRATDAFGSELAMGPSSVLVTNGKLHPVMLEILAKHAEKLRRERAI
jgi:myo-inositol-1(or 4)-monophosphatase